LARHVAAVHGREALERVRSVHMRGTSDSLINTVRTGEVELAWDSARGFTWNDASGFQFGHDDETGWMIQPRSSPTVLTDESLAALREAGDMARLFDPARGYASMESVGATVFEGSECHAIRARTSEGYARTLYFDVESGLYAGHEGEGGVDEPIHYGGPVQPEMGFVLFEEMEYEGSMPVVANLWLGTSLDILRDIAAERGPSRFLFCLGYAGWAPDQLEDEIARNDWLVVPADPELLFRYPAGERWNKAIRMLGIDPGLLSQGYGTA